MWLVRNEEILDYVTCVASICFYYICMVFWIIKSNYTKNIHTNIIFEILYSPCWKGEKNNSHLGRTDDPFEFVVGVNLMIGHGDRLDRHVLMSQQCRQCGFCWCACVCVYFVICLFRSFQKKIISCNRRALALWASWLLKLCFKFN